MKIVKSYTDVELVAAIKSPLHIDSAIKIMYRAYYDLLKIYICNNSGNDEDAQDIFQEVLVAFIDLAQKDKFRGESSIKTFLYTLNRNIWLNELKKRGRALKRELVFENKKDLATMDISYMMAQHEMQKKLLSIVEELGETCKKILLAYYYQDQSMKEIFASLNYESKQAVRNKKCKCLKQLEQLLTANPQLAHHLKPALTYEQ